jgi:ferric-chelate reductase
VCDATYLDRWQRKLDKCSLSLGLVLPFTIALLFLPVTRGSPILRMIDVPFEQAVKYHRWIGNLTVLLVALHGILYGVYYGVIHQVHLVNDHQIHLNYLYSNLNLIIWRLFS